MDHSTWYLIQKNKKKGSLEKMRLSQDAVLPCFWSLTCWEIGQYLHSHIPLKHLCLLIFVPYGLIFVYAGELTETQVNSIENQFSGFGWVEQVAHRLGIDQSI